LPYIFFHGKEIKGFCREYNQIYTDNLGENTQDHWFKPCGPLSLSFSQAPIQSGHKITQILKSLVHGDFFLLGVYGMSRSVGYSWNDLIQFQYKYVAIVCFQIQT